MESTGEELNLKLVRRDAEQILSRPKLSETTRNAEERLEMFSLLPNVNDICQPKFPHVQTASAANLMQEEEEE